MINLRKINITNLRSRLRLSTRFFTQWHQIHLGNLIVYIYAFTLLFTLFASANPWPLWQIYRIYIVGTSILSMGTFFLANQLRCPIFHRKGTFWPIATMCVLLFWLPFVNGRNIFGFILQLLHISFLVTLFMFDKNHLVKIGDAIAKLLGAFLAVSITGFLLYLIRVPLPHFSIVNAEYDYAYECYYLFLIDNRSLFSLFPRFHSLFLEPAHLAMTCIPILMTQIGKWDRWWNKVLFLATILSFSLAGYVFLVYLILSSYWLRGQNIIGKLAILTGILALFTIGALKYNQGNNLLNNLIIQRLTINDAGKLEGDNRVSDSFEREYEQLTQSSAILWGRGSEEMNKFGFGNAGYRVYIYSNGLIAVILLFLALLAIAKSSPYRRNMIVFLGFEALSFIPHATPLKYSMFIPLYIMLFCNFMDQSTSPNS